MSEKKLISPLLDHMKYIGPLSQKNGVECFIVEHEKLCKPFVVKKISIPQSESSAAALLLVGAYKSEADLQSYYAGQVEELRNEVRAISRLHGTPNVAIMLGFQAEPKPSGLGYDVYLLAERWESLAELAAQQRLSRLDAVKMGIDIANGLCALRSAGLVAENVKPENIYRSENGSYMLGDLGFVRLEDMGYNALPLKYQSPFAAPEMMDNRAHPNATMDTYALSMILRWLFSGCPEGPLEGAPKYADYALADILLGACSEDIEERYPSPEGLRDALLYYLQTNSVTDEPIIQPEPETAEPPAGEPATAEEAGAEKPATEEAVTEEPAAAEEAGAEKSATVDATAEKSATVDAAAEKPATVEEAAAEKSATVETGAEQPAPAEEAGTEKAAAVGTAVAVAQTVSTAGATAAGAAKSGKKKKKKQEEPSDRFNEAENPFAILFGRTKQVPKTDTPAEKPDRKAISVSAEAILKAAEGDGIVELTPQTEENAPAGEAAAEAGNTPAGEAAAETGNTPAGEAAAEAGNAPAGEAAVPGEEAQPEPPAIRDPFAQILDEYIPQDPEESQPARQEADLPQTDAAGTEPAPPEEPELSGPEEMDDEALQRAVEELLSTGVAQDDPEPAPEDGTPEDTLEKPPILLPEDGLETPSHSEKHLAVSKNEGPEEKPAPKKPRRKKKTLILMSIVLLLAALLVGAYLFLWKWYFIEVSNIELVEKGYNYITVAVTANMENPELTVTCADGDGNLFPGEFDGKIATFTGLSSNTRYTIGIQAAENHKLTQSSTDWADITTYESTSIAGIDTAYGKTEGSMEVTIRSDGGLAVPSYQLSYGTEGEQWRTVTVEGSQILLTDLTLNKEYTLRLSDYDTYFMVGNTSTTCTAVPLTLAGNLEVSQIVDNTITVRWDCAANPPEYWEVSCVGDDGYEQHLTVTDCTATFTDTPITTAYHITVTTPTMYDPVEGSIDANPILVDDLTAQAVAADTITVSWESRGGSPEGGWVITYSADDYPDSLNTVTTQDTTFTLENCIPEAAYTIRLAGDWRTTLGNMETSCTTPAAEDFDQYGITARSLATGLYTCPTKEGWTWRDLSMDDYRSSFRPGEKVAFALEITGRAKSSDDKVVILTVVRDENRKPLQAYCSEPNAPATWNTMWSNSRYVDQVLAPDTPGSYTICFYLNGHILREIPLKVTE